jgi:hypothetical protein
MTPAKQLGNIAPESAKEDRVHLQIDFESLLEGFLVDFAPNAGIDSRARVCRPGARRSIASNRQASSTHKLKLLPKPTDEMVSPVLQKRLQN